MKPHPPHKILIEKTPLQLWQVVARPTTRIGLHSGKGMVLSEAFETAQAARPEFDQVVRFRGRVVALG